MKTNDEAYQHFVATRDDWRKSHSEQQAFDIAVQARLEELTKDRDWWKNQAGDVANQLLEAKQAPAAATAHETIVAEGAALVCTACGTTAPADAGQAQALADAELPPLPRWDKSENAGYKCDPFRYYSEAKLIDYGRACMALRQPAMSPAQIFELADRYFEWNAEDWKKATTGTVVMTSLLAFVRAATTASQPAQCAAPDERAADKALDRVQNVIDGDATIALMVDDDLDTVRKYLFANRASEPAAQPEQQPVAMVTKNGSGFGPGLKFLANGNDLPKPGTLLYAEPVRAAQSGQQPIAWHCVHSVTGRMLYTDSESEMVNMRDALAKHWKITPLVPADAPAPTPAVRDVLAERQRQVEAKGWTHQGDDKYEHNQLPRAAACYAVPELVTVNGLQVWPWNDSWWKPSDPRRNCVKAAALLLAEIERIDRAAAPVGGAT